MTIVPTVLQLLFFPVVHAQFQRAAVEALAEMAGPEPAPEIRKQLPDVKALVRDPHQPSGARKAPADAAERIDRLTVDLRELPIAAAPPETHGDQLLRVATGDQAGAKELPLPERREEGC